MPESEFDRLRRRIEKLEAELDAARAERSAEATPVLSAGDGAILDAVILESSRDCITILDLDGNALSVSPGGIAGMEIVDVETVLGPGWLRDWAEPDREAARAAVADARAGGVGRFEGCRPTPAGAPKWWDVVVSPIPGPDGRPARLVGVGRDVSATRLAERRLRDSEENTKLITDALPILISYIDADGVYRFVNAHYQTWFGKEPASIVGKRLADVVGPELYAKRKPLMDRAMAGEHIRFEATIPTPDGDRFEDLQYIPRRAAAGHVDGIYVLGFDLTARKKADAIQRALIALGDRLRDTADVPGIIAAASEIMGRTLDVTRAGYGKIDCLRETVTIHEDWTTSGVCSIAGVLRFRDYGTYIEELKNGTPVAVVDTVLDSRTAATADALAAIAVRSFINFPLREYGDFAALFFVNHAEPRVWSDEDLAFIGKVADRAQAAIARLDAENDLRALAASLEAQVAARTRERDQMWRTSQDLFVICGFDGLYRSVNPAWTDTLGFTVAELIGMPFDLIAHPNDVEATRATFTKLVAGEVIRDFDLRLRAKAGDYRWFSWHCIPDGDQFYAAGRDITARKELEEQLRQAQKMEAVGQLTGGIAHDFNNLLTGIVGSLDLMQTRIAQGRVDALARYIDAAMNSANRAAALTHRLLAFSRRQPLDPKPVNANALIASLEDLLRRTMGETTVIEIVAAGGLWMTLCDPNQLESAILNLAINARDAMPDGGKLTIETANTHLDRAYVQQHAGVEPGQYVCIGVTDTGTGMTPDVIARAFEPFFTTKPIGQGTGLGLSMIYGFARQSEGHAAIYSEVGQGTTFKIYLPRYRGPAVVAEPASADLDATRAEDGETIMIVEDEGVVRALIAETLADLGYHIRQAVDGPSGLAILESDKRVDLLVTDVGLPGLNGRQLAERARDLRPSLKVLFITGYAENAMFGNGQLAPGMQMITKPFTIETLTQRVREMIAG